MSYLIDTNVISEVFKKTPDTQVLKWFESIPSSSLYLSVITFGEIRKGIEKLDYTEKKITLLAWLEHELPAWFEERVLTINIEVADRWGYLLSTANKPIPAIDSLIAATALTHNLKLVTRNIKDFINIPGLETINPWG